MKRLFVSLTVLVLLVVGVMPTFAQDNGPEFAQTVVSRRVTSQETLRDAADSSATRLMTVAVNDRVEILASDGEYNLVNVYRPVSQSTVYFNFVGFGWISSNADLVTTGTIRVSQSECSLTTGGVQVESTSIVEFGEGWAWSLVSAEGCNVLAEGRPLDSTNDTHHYWSVVDRHPSAGTGQFAEEAQVTRYTTNGVFTALEGTVWLYPVRWNMSAMNSDPDDQPIVLEFAKQKRLAGMEYNLVLHDLRGRTVEITDSMLNDVVPQIPDSFTELTAISVTGIRGTNGEVVASVGSNNACWVVIGQTDTDEAIEVVRYCGLFEGFTFYNSDETFFWMLPDNSTQAEASAMVTPELASYITDLVGLGVEVEVDASGFGSSLRSGDYSVGLGS